MIQLNNGILDFSCICQYAYTNKELGPNYLYVKTVEFRIQSDQNCAVQH